MVLVQNKRLMLSEGIDRNTPDLNDFMFFGGGGGKGGGGGGKTVYVVPKAPEQASANNLDYKDITTDVATGEADEIIGGKNKQLGGTRKLAIPVTTSR